MNERDILEHERANIVDAITEMEQEIREDEARVREYRAVATDSVPDWYSKKLEAETRHDATVVADKADRRIAEARVRLVLRRQWFKGIDAMLGKA